MSAWREVLSSEDSNPFKEQRVKKPREATGRSEQLGVWQDRKYVCYPRIKFLIVKKKPYLGQVHQAMVCDIFMSYFSWFISMIMI